MISIYGNNWQQGHLADLRTFFQRLRHTNVKFAVFKDFAQWLISRGFDLQKSEIVDAIPEGTSLLISVGGDGTFLRAVAWLGGRPVPVMGINTGHLGYLAGFGFEDMEGVMSAINGEYSLSERMLIELHSPHIPEDFSPYALNEVSVAKGDTTSMVSINAFLDGKWIADFQGDGLLVSTPTGSTAYNLSCGGPILAPSLSNFILTPVAPHSLTFRPLVIGSESELELEVNSRGENCYVGVDGRTFVIPPSGTRLKLRRASFKVNVVQPPGSTFSAVLRRKLGWGAK